MTVDEEILRILVDELNKYDKRKYLVVQRGKDGFDIICIDEARILDPAAAAITLLLNLKELNDLAENVKAAIEAVWECLTQAWFSKQSS